MTVYKKKNGKWYYKFQINGERKHGLCHGANDIKQAKAIEDIEKFKLRQQQGGIIARDLKNIPLNKITNIYLEYSKINKKSYNTDVSRARLINGYFGDHKLIKDIKPENIERFKTYLLSLGRSKVTVNRYLEQLSCMFNMAVDNQYLLQNPCKNVRKFPSQNYSIRYLTNDEEKRLYEHLPVRLIPIVTIALHTGLRKGNILNLKWEQINFDFRFIEILENKGNKHIILPMNEIVYELLKELREQSISEYLFINPQTNLPYTDISNAWENTLRKAGISNLRFHDLRHTVGTRLAKENVPINVIKEILAHSDIKTTMRYVHCTDGAKLNALSKLHSYN